MKMLSESSCASLLLTPFRYLHLLLCNVALALLNKVWKYWNVKKVGSPAYVFYASVAFTFVNLMVQQLKAVFTECCSYDSRFAWAAFCAAIFQLLGAASAYIVDKNKLHLFSSLAALMLLALAIFSITFEHDTSVQAVLLCQLLQFVLRLSELIPQYYLLLDGLTVPLSLVSTGDAREEDSHILKLDPSSWLEVREDYADMFKIA